MGPRTYLSLLPTKSRSWWWLDNVNGSGILGRSAFTQRDLRDTDEGITGRASALELRWANGSQCVGDLLGAGGRQEPAR